MNPSKNSLASQRSLVFITAEYPFGRQETFIEHEISILSEAFDQIIVLPKNTPGSPRIMPSNCVIGTPYGSRHHSIGWRTLFQECFRLMGHWAKSKIAYRSWQGINKRLTQIKTSTNDIEGEITYYSYWLDEGAMAAAFLAQRDGAFAISRAHGWDVYPVRHPHKYLPYRSYLASSELVVCPISKHGAEALRDQGFNNLDLFYLGTPPPKKAEAKNRQGTKTLVSISSCIELKRVQRIAAIFAVLYQSDSTWRWNHFGDGPLEAEVKGWLDRSGVEGYSFHGRQSNETVHQWLSENANNTLFINQSTTEGLPVSMMEAMSVGIPCVGTNVGGVSEIIEDGNNGLLHDDDLSVEAVAHLIQALDEDRFHAMAENAKNTWQNKFNAEKNYMAFLKRFT